MTKRKALSRAGLIVVIAVSLFFCPLATGGYAGTRGTSAKAQVAQISFEPQLTPLDIEATPQVTTVPTLGPGQAFGDLDLPATGRVHGNDGFGWADISGYPGLVLVWVTDETGTRYLAVNKTSDLFLGTPDPKTNERAEDGFEHYVGQTETIQSERVNTASQGIGSGAAILALGWGLALCPETAGAGCIGGIVVAAALAVGNAVTNFIKLQRLNHDLKLARESLADKLSEISSSVQP